MTTPVDRALLDKKPRFLGIFLVTSLIGVVLISIAVYRASQELEVIHEVNNMSRMLRSLLGEKAIGQLVRGEHPPAHGAEPILSDPAYRLFVLSENGLRPLQSGAADDKHLPEFIDLESTRVNGHGGYFEADGAIHTWTLLHHGEDPRALLVVHTFRSTGADALVHVYQKRMIIPVLFYLWLTVWVSLILNHLVRELRAQKDQLKQMALHDALTGLPNRKLMQDRLSKQVLESRRNGTQFSFGVIDLNGFKGVNDRYGHLYGDELLRQAAKRIESSLRGADTVARFGGDEFTVLLSSAEESAWRTVFERISAALDTPYNLSDTQVSVRASIGASVYPVHGEDAETLLFNADQAMYVAKAQGGGICVFQPGADGDGLRSRTLNARVGSGASIYSQS